MYISSKYLTLLSSICFLILLFIDFNLCSMYVSFKLHMCERFSCVCFKYEDEVHLSYDEVQLRFSWKLKPKKDKALFSR